MPRLIRIGTRSSPMAVHQAEQVSAALCALDPEVTPELVKITTSGDKWGGRSVQARRQRRLHP